MGPADKPKPTKALTEVVNKLINRKIETKYRAENILVEGGTQFNSVISTAADWYRCLPLVGQGANTHQRVGDSLTPTKLRLDFTFLFGRDSLDYTRDIWVVLYIMTSKNQKAYATNAANGQLAQNFQQYLDNGDGSSTYFQGTFADSTKPMFQPNNTQIKKITFNLMKASGDTNGQGVVPTAGGGGGMYAHERQIRVNKSYVFKTVPKLKYQDSSTQLPGNYAPMWACGYYYGDGTAADQPGPGILNVGCRAHLFFKDA